MSDSSEGPWSNNPDTLQIPYLLYLGEKESFAGTLIGSMLYGRPAYQRYVIVYIHLPHPLCLPFQVLSFFCSPNV